MSSAEPDRAPKDARSRWKAIAFCIPVALLCGYLNALIYTVRPQNPYRTSDGLIPMVAGTAARPFVKRALLPSLARWLTEDDLAIPAQPTALPPPKPNGTIASLFVRQWTVDAAHSRVVVTVFVLMTLAYALFAGALLLAFVEVGRWPLERCLVVLLYAAAVPAVWSLAEPRQVYDCTTLAGAAVLTWLGLTRRTAAFLAALAFFLFAKESLVVLSLVPALLAYHARAPRKAGLILVVAGVELLIVEWIRTRAYGGNPGENFFHQKGGVWYVYDNLRVIVPTTAFGQRTWLKLAMLLVPASLGWWRASRWTRKVAAAVTAAVALPVLFLGRLGETRVLFELVPLYALLAGPALLAWIGAPTPPVEVEPAASPSPAPAHA